MPYIKEICRAGSTIEITKYFATRFQKKVERGSNEKPTSAQQERINFKNARRNLRRLLNENFGHGDIHLILTYKKEFRPDVDGAKRELAKFIRRLRGVYLKNDDELRYISVTEFRRAAIHHHIVINSIDSRKIVDLWTQGYMKFVFLDSSGSYGKLAEYLMKETKDDFREFNGKRWSQSRNLRQPKVTKTVVQANSWRERVKPLRGYRIEPDSIVMGFSEFSQTPFQFYRMVRDSS